MLHHRRARPRVRSTNRSVQVGPSQAFKLTPEVTLWQYTHGVPDATAVSPDGYSLDDFYLTRPGADEMFLAG